MKEISKVRFNMNNFPTLKEMGGNVYDWDKKKEKNVRGRGEGNVTLIYVLDSHNCGGRISIVSLKDSGNTMT